jgi:hypothetical protein
MAVRSRVLLTKTPAQHIIKGHVGGIKGYHEEPFQKAAGNDLAGWALAGAEAEVRPDAH